MKKFLLSAVTFMAVTMISAQTKSVPGDLDGDGKITVDDITTLIDWYLNDGPDKPVVEPVFDEPITEWGTPMAAVKNLMADYQLVNEEDGELTYMGTGNAITYRFYFDGNNNLYGSEVLVGMVTGEQIDAQLQTNYMVASQTDSVSYYFSEDGATVVILTPMVYGSETYYSVTYVDYNAIFGDDIYLPYLEWGAERESVKDTLAAWGYGEPYYDYDDPEYEYQLTYFVGNYQADSYFFYTDSTITTPLLVEVQQMFVDYTVEELSEIFTTELGYTYDGERVIGEEGEEYTVYDFLSPDEITYASMIEQTVEDEDGDYTLVYIIYYPNFGDEEAKSRTGNARNLLSHVKDVKKMVPAKMVRTAQISKKVAGLKNLKK